MKISVSLYNRGNTLMFCYVIIAQAMICYASVLINGTHASKANPNCLRWLLRPDL